MNKKSFKTATVQELIAIGKIVHALKRVDKDTKTRILRYVMDRAAADAKRARTS
jgi:hypothetical protein